MKFLTRSCALLGEDGVLLVSARIAAPAEDAESQEPAGRFAAAWCRRVSEAGEVFVRTRLLETARQAYAADGREGKRFSFERFVYTLSFSAREEDGRTAVEAVARLSRGTASLGSGGISAVFCAEGICPPPKKRRQKHGLRIYKKS